MNRKDLLLLCCILPCIKSSLITAKNIHPDAGLNINQLVKKHGYPIESHNVVTSDGYILTVHRIPRNGTLNKPPVLMMHGLLSSSADFVNLGPGKALALLLADKGYDVWLGNNRGNTWSRHHASLDPDQDPEKFFDYSFHEIGLYDTTALIDYVLNATAKAQLFYVGHSQGTTDFFVMASERPEYNKKVKLMVALSPVAYLENIPNPVMAQIRGSYDLLETVGQIYKLSEVLPHRESWTELGAVLCSKGSIYQSTCLWLLNMLAGFDDRIDPDFIPVITTSAPAGCSWKQLLHYLQGVISGNFARYDYGTDKNLVRYGQEHPPLYNTTQITAPIIFYYTNNDFLNGKEDVLRLAKELPNLVKITEIPEMNHLEFLWAVDVVELLYNNVISDIMSIN